jgi:hypothetical protein
MTKPSIKSYRGILKAANTDNIRDRSDRLEDYLADVQTVGIIKQSATKELVLDDDKPASGQ